MPSYFYTTKQLLDRLQISDKSLARHVAAKRLPKPLKLSTSRNGVNRYPGEETDAAIQRLLARDV